MATKPAPTETNKKAAQAFWEIQRRIDRSAIPAAHVGPAERASFPAQYVATKDPPLAKYMKYYPDVRRHATSIGAGDFPGNPVVSFTMTQEDIAAIEEKEKMALQMEFDNWIVDSYAPWDNPVMTEWLQQKYPTFFKARLEEMENLHELQKQWQKIQISGIQSIEDLYLLWRVTKDRTLRQRLTSGASIDPPHGEADALVRSYSSGRWAGSAAVNANLIQRGPPNFGPIAIPRGLAIFPPAGRGGAGGVAAART